MAPSSSGKKRSRASTSSASAKKRTKSNTKKRNSSLHPNAFEGGTRIRKYFASDDNTKRGGHYVLGQVAQRLDDDHAGNQRRYLVKYDGENPDEELDHTQVTAAHQEYKNYKFAEDNKERAASAKKAPPGSPAAKKKASSQAKLNFFAVAKTPKADTKRSEAAAVKGAVSSEVKEKKGVSPSETPAKRTSGGFEKKGASSASAKPAMTSETTLAKETPAKRTSTAAKEAEVASGDISVATTTTQGSSESKPVPVTVEKKTAPANGDDSDDDDIAPVHKKPRRVSSNKGRRVIDDDDSEDEDEKPKPNEDKAEAEDATDKEDTKQRATEEDKDDAELETMEENKDYKVKPKTTPSKPSPSRKSPTRNKKSKTTPTPTKSYKKTSEETQWKEGLPSVYDYDLEIPSDDEDKILKAAADSNVKVQVVVSKASKCSNDDTAQKRMSVASSGKKESSITHIKKPYEGGDGFPVLSHPQDMFDDMLDHLITLTNPYAQPVKAGVEKKLGKNQGKLDGMFAVKKKSTDEGISSTTQTRTRKLLLPLLQKLQNRPLRVATMCSGTESPVLALDMIQKSIQDLIVKHKLIQELGNNNNDTETPALQVQHVFSCEIEPFKQGYIERNFQPPLLFRDIRELGQEEAYTAYGGLAKVPNQPGDVDILIAGTSCVDYSGLNNKQKKMEDMAESGQTFQGMLDFLDKAQPPLVVLENVYGAPWAKKVKLFEDRGYTSTFILVDTKDYYIPQTRQRGYLFAVKRTGNNNPKSKTKDKRAEQWFNLVSNLRRPASASLEAFMLKNDDPRVLRGRARLTNESCSAEAEAGDRAGRTDWTKCETRHQYARSNEELGEKRPLTGWSDASQTVMPAFAWNDWVSNQVNRIHDLLDINTLRLAKGNLDCTYKTMIFNLSQNVDRDTIGAMGISQCLTPTGVPYVTNRGGPLVGEELLGLQGIPFEDLLFTKESEANLKDLAGNAMSSTVVGAATLAALVIGHESLGRSDGKRKSSDDTSCQSLVPRPLQKPSAVAIEQLFGRPKEETISLGPGAIASWDQLMSDAKWSARKCFSEGENECLPAESLVVCQECGETSSSTLANPPRRFEEHEFKPLRVVTRRQPADFRKELFDALPMIVSVEKLDINSLKKPAETKSEALWNDWKAAVQKAVTKDNVFCFTELERSRVWTARYVCHSTKARMEVRFERGVVIWYLFAETPLKRGQLQRWLEKPFGRLVSGPEDPTNLTTGKFEICLPFKRKCKVKIAGEGAKVKSWRGRLGLKGGFEQERQHEKLVVSVPSQEDNKISEKVSGTYRLLPKCGTACGSLMIRDNNSSPQNANMYLFLESSRTGVPEKDAFVFASTCHRTAANEFRDIELQLPSDFTPILTGKDTDKERTVFASSDGIWVPTGASLCTKEKPEQSTVSVVAKPVCENPHQMVPVNAEAWRVCAEIASCTVPLVENKILKNMEGTVELNMLKAKSILKSLAFVTSRLSIPDALSSSWVSLDRQHLVKLPSGDDPRCSRCAPTKPFTQWKLVSKGKEKSFLPIEDGREAAVYEKQLKERPPAWVVRLNSKRDQEAQQRCLQIACNAASLVQRAYGNLPVESLVRSMALSFAPGDIEYHFRIVPHTNNNTSDFPPLTFTSNRLDDEASQPPNFLLQLRREQKRSLTWMLAQESTTEPFMEEEVTEEILDGLAWRAEGRVRRPVLVRGGIVADAVGFGKTALTLGLVDSAGSKPPTPPEGTSQHLIPTKATLVIVPGHILGQWSSEIKKFCGNSKKVVVIADMRSLNSASVEDVVNADIVLVSFKLLCNDKYYRTLARLSGVKPDSVPNGKGGRLFDAVYEECLSLLPHRVEQMKKDCSKILDSIDEDAKNALKASGGEFRVDRKKALYKTDPNLLAAGKVKESDLQKEERNPWGFASNQPNVNKVKAPHLEMFFWTRCVVDEFTYLESTERDRVLTLFHGIQSNFRWCLSGTPQHSNFNDIKVLAGLLGVHLGVDESLPGAKLKPGRGNKKVAESTGLENLSTFLEVRSMQWHKNRHVLAQCFLDRFCRQNVAEIDEIPSEEHENYCELPPSQMAVYLELDSHLKSLDMNSKSAMKSKKKSRGDRDSRMQKVLRESGSAEEALLKCATHYEWDASEKGPASSASDTIEHLIGLRQTEMKRLEREIIESLAACYRQHHRILALQPDWNKVDKTEKGEICSALNQYLSEVEESRSVSHGADTAVHERLKTLASLAEAAFRTNPHQIDAQFAVKETEQAEEEEGGDDGKDKSAEKEKVSEKEKLFARKRALANFMHQVRALGKELCGRIRSLRFVEHYSNLTSADSNNFECKKCQRKNLSVDDVAILTVCGHFGCLQCLTTGAAEGKCIDPECSADVSLPHVVSSKRLNLNVMDESDGKYGRKLTAIVEKTREIVDSGDRAIIFSQFDDLQTKVKEALTHHKIQAVEVKGSVKRMEKDLSHFQKEVPDSKDPRVLLLKMDNEQSAGLNLTNLNHAIFVHPLLAGSQSEYDAYETQAIGRIRRYGQKKTVHVHRYLVSNTIDSEIYQERGGRDLRATTGVV